MKLRAARKLAKAGAMATLWPKAMIDGYAWLLGRNWRIDTIERAKKRMRRWRRLAVRTFWMTDHPGEPVVIDQRPLREVFDDLLAREDV
jgi:hypothetical protein